MKCAQQKGQNLATEVLRVPQGCVINRVWAAALCCLVLAMAGRVSPAYAQVPATTTTFTYDELGNVKSQVRPLSRSATYSYDALGRLKQENTAVTGGTLSTKFDYDNLGQLISVTDPRNLVTNYTIDGLSDRTAQTSPDTAGTTYTTDAEGRMLTSTDARGKETAYTYDLIGRVIRVTHASGTPVVFEYDGGPGGAPSEVGQLTYMSDQSGETRFTHDVRGRLLLRNQIVTTGLTSVAKQVGYEYGTSGPDLGKVTRMTYPSGLRVSYGYDVAGRISQIMLNRGDGAGNTIDSSVIPVLDNLQYTPTGDIQSWDWGTQIGLPTYLRTYDLDGRLTSYPLDATGVIRTVTYNAAGLIAGYSHSGGLSPTPFDQTFAYDLADRLVSATQGGVATTYAYDANGNRTQQTGVAGTYTFSTSSNRLLSANFPVARTYSYDAAGNRTGDGTSVFNYGDDGRLGSASSIGMQASYLYNGHGERVAKTVNGAVTVYAYDGEGKTLGEYANGQYVEVVYLGSLPLAAVTANGAFMIFADHLNTPLAVITPGTGALMWDWRLRDPFGATLPNLTLAPGLPYFNHRFPGQIADSETGLYYNYFRDYDPHTGRYIQSDPIGLGGGINTYGYVGGNPLSRVDPNGLQAFPMPMLLPPPAVPYGGMSPAPGADPSFPGTQHFWPKVIRDAAQAINDACTPDDPCKELNNDVQRAKDKVGRFQPAACKPGMSRWELSQRMDAWLDEAKARSHRDQKCWAGGDAGHQAAQASAWSHVGNCGRLLN